jgi:DNA-binding beta-propeller fold protein YncE
MKTFFNFVMIFTVINPASLHAALNDLKSTKTSNFLLSTAKTGSMPKGVKVDPVGRFAFVAEMAGKYDPLTKMRIPTTSVFDLETRTLSQTIVTPVGIRKDGILANTEVEFSFDERWAMITRAEGDANSEIYKNQGLLTVVNNDSHHIAKYIPLKGAGSKIIGARPIISDDPEAKQIVYVANYFSDDISIIDITDLKEDGNLDGTSYFKGRITLATNFKNPASRGYFIAPRGIAFTPDGKYALILATETGSIIVVDTVKNEQIVEIAPIDSKTVGRDLNVRHIVVSANGKVAYLSHMRGNAISRINMTKLISTIKSLPTRGKKVTLPSTFWDEILIPFKTKEGAKKIMVLEDYPADHPNFPSKKWDYSHPNTIVLDPIRNRYLYVSSRTTTNKDDSTIDPKIVGKVDIIDTEKDQIVYSLVGGVQPTGLDISKDGKMLISSGLINDMLYFYDVGKILSTYEK